MMCVEWFKRIFSSPDPVELPPLGDKTWSSVMVGDYAGSANDLDGPPHDMEDIRKAILDQWPDFKFREFLNKEATGDRLLNEFREAITDLPADGMLLVIMDNCFSDTNTRNGSLADIKAYRYHPPADVPDTPVIVRQVLRGAERKRVLVISASQSSQTAADAAFHGRVNGALHYCLIKTLESGITYRQWFERTKAMLAQLGFSQIPTLDGPVELQNRLVLEGKVRVIDVSSHGSTVKDKDGDEPDGRDEAIVMYDRFVIDDEIRAILDAMPE